MIKKWLIKSLFYLLIFTRVKLKICIVLDIFFILFFLFYQTIWKKTSFIHFFFSPRYFTLHHSLFSIPPVKHRIILGQPEPLNNIHKFGLHTLHESNCPPHKDKKKIDIRRWKYIDTSCLKKFGEKLQISVEIL